MENRWSRLGSAKSTESHNNIKNVCAMLKRNLNTADPRPPILLGHGDPSAFPCFRTTPVAEEAIVDALKSAKFNSYAPSLGLLQARRSIAEYLSRDLPYKLTPDDVFVTSGCKDAIHVMITVLARAGSNVLLPRPGFPRYEACAAFSQLEVRHYELLPEKGWEVCLDSIESLTDDKTAAVVVINPGNPCGNVYSHQHLREIAETAKKLGILVIADEVYGHLSFGDDPFVPMGSFGSVVPVITLGSISKRWAVPGWRLGWIVMNDPLKMLQESAIVECIKSRLDFSSEPVTFIQGAIPKILQDTTEQFFSSINSILKEAAEKCFSKVNEIPCIACPHKPQGSMFVMVKLEVSLLEDIKDDMDFCLKLAKEESVVVLPGAVVGMKNWLRVTFAVEPLCLEDGLERIKAFCHRHSVMR
ncbi:hypothetical protein BT93_A1624 [Corymbia citriodora subsp. variegata]|nr:hypothetical protein BT93_A1624 [Corymbia citriodora subsp. variegata]